MQRINFKQCYFFPDTDIRMLGEEILNLPSLLVLCDGLSGACYGFGFAPETTVEELVKVRNAFLAYIRSIVPNFRLMYGGYDYPSPGRGASGTEVRYIFAIAGKEYTFIAPAVSCDSFLGSPTKPSLATEIRFLSKIATLLSHYKDFFRISLRVEEDAWGDEEVEA